MQTALAIVGAYLLGSISFAVLVSKVMGLPDPHTYGSKNPARPTCCAPATRSPRCLRWWATRPRAGSRFGWLRTTGELAAVGLAAFLGHLYPVFHRFQGGKGVATAAGVLLALDWRVGLGTIVTWLVIPVALRYSSLAALVAALFARSRPRSCST